LAETTGEYVRPQQKSTDGDIGQTFKESLKIPLGNLQYGQSRDVYLDFGLFFDPNSTITVDVDFNLVDGVRSDFHARKNILDTSSLPAEEIAYHISRSRICAFLSSLAPLSNEQHQAISAKNLPEKRVELETLISSISSLNHFDEASQSLLTDLAGPDPAGQIRLAISTDTYYNRWGKHYLPSLHNAYAKQICNSFKDAGPLQFGKHSPLFNRCRDRLDRAFDSLPAPKPSVVLKDVTGQPIKSRAIVMSSYHRKSNPCFTGDCVVRLGDVDGQIILQDVTPGISVWTPAGSRKVVSILRTNVQDEDMCILGTSRVTPFHPVCVQGKWVFPNDIAEKRTVYTGMIYSLLLEEDPEVNAHAVDIGGITAVTLGHGLTEMTNNGDVRAHPFLGSYEKVVQSLELLSIGPDGALVSGGMVRDKETGLACGFLKKRCGKVYDMGRSAVEHSFGHSLVAVEA
jgi:hypothetical protein